MTSPYDNHAFDLTSDLDFFSLLTGSYQRIVGRRLVQDGQGPDWLYNYAPFVVLAHNTEPDPRFIYANRTAQTCFEYGWEEFVSLPSRLSAEQPDRAERQRLLDSVTRDGFVENGRGVRIAKSGRRFWIEKVTVWQLVDEKANGWARLRHFLRGGTSSWQSSLTCLAAGEVTASRGQDVPPERPAIRRIGHRYLLCALNCTDRRPSGGRCKLAG